MEIVRLGEREPFITLDGSEIRELAGVPSGNSANQSLAQATVPPGGRTERHYHRRSEEIYLFTAGAERLLLDNMTPAELRVVVEHVDGRAELEASGGVTLENLRAVAETGVDFVSLGALTHSATTLDFSLLFAEAERSASID